MAKLEQPLTFYGDDFTGSVDVLLQYQHFGLSGIIFLGSPTAAVLREAAEEYDVIGIAGTTRAMPVDEIERLLHPAFDSLRDLDPAVVQYKVCSTADSSPLIGSFAPAINLGRRLFGSHPVPFLVAQPALQRFTVFSNHFAAYRGSVHRIDRQKVMMEHPVTPMQEADLRVHIAQQLNAPVGAITLVDLRNECGQSAYSRAAADGLAVVVIDALTDNDLHLAGDLIIGIGELPIFAVGSGGLSVALASSMGYEQRAILNELDPAGRPCLAVSGSCSEVTKDQIRYAMLHGWCGIPLDIQLLRSDPEEAAREAATRALSALNAGSSAVVYTCGEEREVSGSPLPVTEVAQCLSYIIRRSRKEGAVDRVLIAGGDTSGHVITALGCTSISSKQTVGDHTLLCTINSPDAVIDATEVVLKGGQIGDDDFFELVRTGYKN